MRISDWSSDVCSSDLLAFGLNTLRDVPLDVFPEFVAPQVTVQVEAPGLTPEQVEQRVTTPLEAALAGAPGLDSMRSESIAGLAEIGRAACRERVWQYV